MPNREIFKTYEKLFIEENNKVNLISKNDEKFLWEKHICDSLSLSEFFNKYGLAENILDIGTGGGFPSVPLALAYPSVKITALDSIAKKIRAVQVFKDKLKLDNLEPICSRVENFNKKFEVVTSRAVASLDKICEYALPKLKPNGYFVAFKSKKYQQEIDAARMTLVKFHAKVIDVMPYKLPLDENFERVLIVIKKF